MTAAQEWMLEGMQKGLVKGREEGERVTLASMLTRLVRLRFREVSPEIVARIEAATNPELERCIERILTAETLDDVFA